MGNEYHTVACVDTETIYLIEIIEGRDKTEEGLDSKKQFDGEMDSNIVAFVARIYLCICSSSIVVVIDSVFCYILNVIELLKLDLSSTYVIKKRKGWSKYTKTEEVLSEIHGKIVGTIVVRKDNAVEGGYPLILAVQVGSRYTSIMLSS